MFYSSGVEKIIKVWSPYPMSQSDNDIPEKIKNRKVMSLEESQICYELLEVEEGNTTVESLRTIGLFDYFNYHPFDNISSDSDEEIVMEYIMDDTI